MLITLIIWIYAACATPRLACPEELSLLSNASPLTRWTTYLFRRALPDAEISQVDLSLSDVNILFQNVEDRWQKRVERYLLKRMGQKRLDVQLVTDPKLTGYAAGTHWNSGNYHHIQILLYPGLMGSLKFGLIATIRRTLIHEATHARVAEYEKKWLLQRGLDPSVWGRRLDTPQEEWLARTGDQFCMGRQGKWARWASWWYSGFEAGTWAKPWLSLEAAWLQKIKRLGIEVPEINSSISKHRGRHFPKSPD